MFTVSPGLAMAVLPCANPHGILRFGRRGLKNPCGFRLFWLFDSLFLMGDNPCFKQGSPAMAVSVILSCFKYCVYK